MFRKNVGALQLERQTLFFLKIKLATSFSHHRVSAVTSQKLATFFCSHHSPLHSAVGRPFFRHAKNTAPFVEVLFVGPLFGPTCWTCLNPPLTASKRCDLICRMSVLCAMCVFISQVRRCRGYLSTTMPARIALATLRKRRRSWRRRRLVSDRVNVMVSQSRTIVGIDCVSLTNISASPRITTIISTASQLRSVRRRCRRQSYWCACASNHASK